MIRLLGGAETVVHLAAHYDFTGEEHPEYQRTNVEGLRNTLDLSRRAGREAVRLLELRRGLPAPGARVGPHGGRARPTVTTSTRAPRAIGEAMVEGVRGCLPARRSSASRRSSPTGASTRPSSCSSRRGSRRRGTGTSSAAAASRRSPTSTSRTSSRRSASSSTRRPGELAPGEVLIASPDGSTSHRELFEEATRDLEGEPRRPILMPRLLCGPGMWARALARAADRARCPSSAPGWRATST